MKLNKHRTGMALAAFLGIIALIWDIVLASGLAQTLVNWKMHFLFISMPITVLPFSLGTGIALIVACLVKGYIVGYLFAIAWNWAHR